MDLFPPQAKLADPEPGERAWPRLCGSVLLRFLSWESFALVLSLGVLSVPPLSNLRSPHSEAVGASGGESRCALVVC